MVTKITFGGYQGDNSVHTRAARILCEAIKREAGDAVEVTFDQNIVARGHKAADLLSLTEAGDLSGCYFSSSYLADRVPELGLFDQHFVVPDRAHAYAVLDGALGAWLAKEVEARTGYTVLGYWDNGLRNISANHPLRQPQDCEGLKIRTLANEDHQRVFRALGFDPMKIDVRDLPEAVRNGTVDAQENPLTNIYNFDLHKTHRHITLTRHLLGVAIVLFNKDQVAAWPDNIRQAVQTAVAEATKAQRRFAEDDDTTCAEAMAKDGVELIELTAKQRAMFREATRDQVAAMRARFNPDLIDMFESDLKAVHS
ncbi:TRAP transporter substrate-binding protein [Phaeobacter marinintestinus]|uniref:TRAP transporter substrate-binding protein n=1 Tax=Falsiphaeobacter marinintestinus TaxID=1492905 RepID=UPI0011B6469B|nr:TRAP transporter substrate-binding protein [Phaeobacter marinintestinus]